MDGLNLADMTGRKRRAHLSHWEVDRIAISQADDPGAWGKAVSVQPEPRHGYQERIVLLRDLPEEGLRAGDIGTIVEHYPASGNTPAGYEVEFFAANGDTVAVASVQWTPSAPRQTGISSVPEC